MRILMTTDTVGGVWTYTRELATGLLASACDITLVTLGRAPSREQQRWLEETTDRWPDTFRARTTEYPLEWMQDNASVLAESQSLLLDCIREFDIELIHSNQFCYGALPVDLPKLIVAHSDVVSWWRSCRGSEPDATEWIANYRALVGRGLRNADMLVAPTRWMLDQIQSTYGDSTDSAVISNGRDVPVAAALPPPKLQAVTAGRLWDEGKNVGILREISSPLPVLVAGDSCFSDARATTLNRPWLQELGCLMEPEMLRLLAVSAIYIATSQYEPFGLAPVEAALSGCAIVANDIPSLREVWGDDALYYACNDPAALSHVLQELADRPERIQEMARRAGERARRCYSRKQMTAGYLELYGQLIHEEATAHAA